MERKFFLLFIASLLALTSYAAPGKSPKLTNVSVNQAAQGYNVDLTFDHSVSAKNLKPSFERNFMQLVLKDTKIDSARIVPAGNGEGQFQKVFAYAYSPDVARVRFLFNSLKAPQNKITLSNAKSNVVRVLIKDEVGKAAQVVAVPQPVSTASSTEKNDADKELIQEVVSNTREIDIHNPESIKAALTSSGIEKTPKTEVKQEPIGRAEPAAVNNPDKSIGTKSEPSRHFFRMIMALLAVVAIFAGVVFLFKRYSNKINKLPFGKKERIIQVIATHYMGNKKSISLVRIAGEYMVVGVGNDGLSLLSKLGPEVNVDKYLEDRFWGGTVEKHLDSFASDKQIAKENKSKVQIKGEKPALNAYDGVRDLAVEDGAGLDLSGAVAVSDKVEISTVRTTIKEKLSKLKPLT